MYAKLFCKTGQLAGATYDIKGEATIGKNAVNTVQLYPSVVSGRHARIYFDSEANCYFLEDLRSRNGTKLDGMKVHGKEKLAKLHVITFAHTFDFIFQVVEDEERILVKKKTKVSDDELAKESAIVSAGATTRVDDQVIPLPPIEAEKETEGQGASDDRAEKTMLGDEFVPLPDIPESADAASEPDPGKTVINDKVVPPPSIRVEDEKPSEKLPRLTSFYSLEVITVKGEKQSFKLKEGENIVGRSTTCDVSIDDSSISRNHAVLFMEGRKVTLKDLGSKNHTFIDNQRINYEVEIKPDTEIVFGLVKARLVRRDG